LGLILIRNFNQRRSDFGLMLAQGFSVKSIRKTIFGEHARILLAGMLTGIISALIATRPSVMNYSDLPWGTLAVMIILILLSGIIALAVSVRSVNKDTLITRIRKE